MDVRVVFELDGGNLDIFEADEKAKCEAVRKLGSGDFLVMDVDCECCGCGWPCRDDAWP